MGFCNCKFYSSLLKVLLKNLFTTHLCVSVLKWPGNFLGYSLSSFIYKVILYLKWYKLPSIGLCWYKNLWLACLDLDLQQWRRNTSKNEWLKSEFCSLKIFWPLTRKALENWRCSKFDLFFLSTWVLGVVFPPWASEKTE